MLLRLAITFSAFFFGSVAFAGFDGKYSGQATYTTKGGMGETYPLNVMFTNDGFGNLMLADDFTLNKHFFTLSGEEVSYEGTVVGKLTADQFDVVFTDKYDSDCTYTYHLDSAGKYSDLHDCTTGYWERMEGVFTRAP